MSMREDRGLGDENEVSIAAVGAGLGIVSVSLGSCRRLRVPIQPNAKV